MLEIIPTILLDAAPTDTPSIWTNPLFTGLISSLCTAFAGYLVMWAKSHFNKPKVLSEIGLSDINTKKTEAEIIRETREDLAKWVNRYRDLIEEVASIEAWSDDVYRIIRNYVKDFDEFQEELCPLLETHQNQVMALPMIGVMNLLTKRINASYEDIRLVYEKKLAATEEKP